MAAVFCASFRRRAMVWRRRVMRTRSSRAASSTGTGARGRAAAGAGAATAGAGVSRLARAVITSSFMIRPSLPVPVTAVADSPVSAISFFAEGASSVSRAGAGAGASAFAGVGVGAAAVAPPITANWPPACTVAPEIARISVITPAAGAGTSTETLSVSSSQSISSCATLSPTFLNQVATVASATLSPRVGTITLTAAVSAAAAAGLAAGAAAGLVPPSEMVAKSALTPTVCPSAAMISPRVPAEGAGTSTVTLSVSSSQSISSAAMVSPGFLNHVATVASDTLSPRVGTRTSILMRQFPSKVSASFTSASCCALCLEARPVAGEAEATRPT